MPKNIILEIISRSVQDDTCFISLFVVRHVLGCLERLALTLSHLQPFVRQNPQDGGKMGRQVLPCKCWSVHGCQKILKRRWRKVPAWRVVRCWEWLWWAREGSHTKRWRRKATPLRTLNSLRSLKVAELKTILEERPCSIKRWLIQPDKFCTLCLFRLTQFSLLFKEFHSSRLPLPQITEPSHWDSYYRTILYILTIELIVLTIFGVLWGWPERSH